MSKALGHPRIGAVPIANNDSGARPVALRLDPCPAAPPPATPAAPPPALAFSRSGDWLVVRRRSSVPGPSPAEDIDGLRDRLVPVLVLADTAEERDQIMRMLTEQLEAARGCAPEPEGHTTALGELLIDRRAHRVTVDGREVALTALEFRLLSTLADRADQVQSRGALLADVWGMNRGSATRTVDTHIKRLRDKIRSAGRYIQSVRGVGYRFSDKSTAEIQRARSALQAAIPASPAAPPAGATAARQGRGVAGRVDDPVLSA